MIVSLQELKSLLIGVILVCGVMLAGPLTSHASPVDPFALLSTTAEMANAGTKAGAKTKPRLALTERFSSLLGAPKVSQTTLDLTATTATDFGDWDDELPG
jgi:hypothetical protein